MIPRHFLIWTLGTALVVVLAGLFVVERHNSVAPTGSTQALDTYGGYVEHKESPPTNEHSSLPNVAPQLGTDSPQESLAIPVGAPAPSSTPQQKTVKNDGAADFNTLLAGLAREKNTQPAAQKTSTYEELLAAFSIAPSVPTVSATPRMQSPQQQAIFAYGNRIGAYLQGFAAVNLNMGKTVSDQVAHRSNQAMNDAVRDLGDRYTALGTSILTIHDVPTSAKVAHEALANSYVQLGTALRRVPDAADDQSFLKAITAYNAKADAYTAAFVGMVTLFSANDVTFESTDAGSVFSFHHN